MRYKTKELTCIACPRGCRIKLQVKGKEVLKIAGNLCKKGINYTKEEFTAPSRILTTTVRVKNAKHSVTPVRTNKPISKSQIFPAMKILNKVALEAPVKLGEIVINNILDTGVDIISSRNLAKEVEN